MNRQWNEPKTVKNDQKTLARHLVEDHGANQIPAYAAPLRMLLDVHDDYHKSRKPVPA